MAAEATMAGPLAAVETAVETRCAHCGLPVPAGLVVTGETLQFCCHGCRTARAVITACGLDRYYALVESAAEEPAPAKGTGGKFAEFDDATFLSLHSPVRADGLREVELAFEGMHCAACVWLLEKLPKVVPGVVEARVELRRQSLRVRWDAGVVPLSRVARALDSLGYPPHPARERAARERRCVEDRGHLVRIAVAGALAGNVMLLGFALYGGVFDTMEAVYLQLFRWLSCALGLVSLAWPGAVFFRAAWGAVRTRSVNLDLPIVVALAAGGVSGLVNTILNTGELYFDSLTALVFFLLVGRFVQHRQQRWATDSVELLFTLMPSTAQRVDELTGQAAVTPIDALSVGDLVEIRAGDSIPVDGLVEQGRSEVDQAILTGESCPVRVGVGSKLFAGTVNLSSVLRVRATETGARTAAGRLMQLVSEASGRKPAILHFTDRVGRWFTAVVPVLSLLTLALWWSIDRHTAIQSAVAMLIVTCPCALALAAPLVMAVAIGRGARRGVLIKGADALERLARPGLFILDKTGTVTQGRVRVVHAVGDQRAMQMAAALERWSSHPIARAVTDHWPGASGAVSDVEAVTGAGLGGRVDGCEVLVGSPAFLRGRGVRVDRELTSTAEAFADDALTPVLVAVNGVAEAALGVGDPLRDDARASVDALRSRGWRVVLLSGDHPTVVRAVGARLGLEPAACRGAASPEDKLAFVREAQACGGPERSPVVMVGDGVNDAAALAAASVGVAVHGGAEASLSAADVYLSRPGLTPLLELLTASSGSVRAVRRTLYASLAYNVVAGACTLAGVIHPILAAIFMPLSSLTMLAIALRSRTFEETPWR